MSAKSGRKCRCKTREGKFKTVYFTEFKALHAAAQVPNPTRVYKCPTTKNYHVTRVGKPQ